MTPSRQDSDLPLDWSFELGDLDQTLGNEPVLVEEIDLTGLEVGVAWGLIDGEDGPWTVPVAIVGPRATMEAVARELESSGEESGLVNPAMVIEVPRQRAFSPRPEELDFWAAISETYPGRVPTGIGGDGVDVPVQFNCIQLQTGAGAGWGIDTSTGAAVLWAASTDVVRPVSREWATLLEEAVRPGGTPPVFDVPRGQVFEVDLAIRQMWAGGQAPKFSVKRSSSVSPSGDTTEQPHETGLGLEADSQPRPEIPVASEASSHGTDTNVATDVPASCEESNCDRPAVFSAVLCRLHLAEAARRDGQSLIWDDPELAGWEVATRLIVGSVFGGLPPDVVETAGWSTRMGFSATLAPDDDAGLGMVAMNFLQAHLVDQPSIGLVRLAPLMRCAESEVVAMAAEVATEVLGDHVGVAMQRMLQEAVSHPVRIRGLFRLRDPAGGEWGHTLAETSTSREEVIQMVASGYTNYDLAKHLLVGPHTVTELLEDAFFPNDHETSAEEQAPEASSEEQALEASVEEQAHETSMEERTESPAARQADWVIEQIRTEGDARGDPLSDEEIAILRRDMRSLGGSPVERSNVMELNNKVVPLIRGAIERHKAAGAESVRVRMGLRIPTAWASAYRTIYDSRLPWVLTGILQNAMLSNPFAGEKRKWKSN